MFSSLTEKLSSIFSRLKGKGKLSEADVVAGLREIRLALLEADVNYKVVKDLLAKIRDKAVGAAVLESLSPGQQLIKIVCHELTTVLGEENSPLTLMSRPSVIMLVGLQGSGKTTSAAKLALKLTRDGRKPILVATDINRPAAVQQLEKLGADIDIPTFFAAGSSPEEIAVAAVAAAREKLRDVVIIDTAGRLQIDSLLMAELVAMKRKTSPDEIFLVADAMTGQEAVNIAVEFDAHLDLTGVILTKLEGDARGGAAISINHVTGKPIKFVGVGEKLDDLELFHPRRMAERILGMGDLLSLIEKAEQQFDRKQAEKLAERIQKDRFTLQDFLEQLEQMTKLGPLSQIINKLPGMGKLAGKVNVDDRDLKKAMAIIRSMTPEERNNPSIISGQRKKRISRGSGTQVREVNQILSRFNEAKKALKLVKGKRGKMNLPFDFSSVKEV
ncbi:signal recognition particle protein [Candidatus Acetothermia bacterium]|jgi:signal recognition particle subunit SRP54|nr:signal recognition particle protein [Candidatus Acetothermia bacterium]MCI2427184.1 signal recognition particle protein [Candidatus Acetothermia bacterium]MCI2428010.1 signal recognition particle protein [Candidatus Acetothermia bacterium]